MKPHLVIVVLFVFLVGCGVSGSLSPATSKSDNTAVASEEKAGTVTTSIVYPKEDKTILADRSIDIKKDDTVLDLLSRVAHSANLQISVSGSGSSAYVEAIDNLYEFDKGPKSGWIVKKNDKKLTEGIGATTVSDGDTIEWIYTEDYDEDF